MDKILFEKTEDGDVLLRISLSSSNGESYEGQIKKSALFSKDTTKCTVTIPATGVFQVTCNKILDEITFSYEPDKSSIKSSVHTIGLVEYRFSDEELLSITIKSFEQFLETQDKLLLERLLVEPEEKASLEFYQGVLKRCEDEGGKNRDNFSAAKSRLDKICSDFPLLNEYDINSISKQLEEVGFLEIDIFKTYLTDLPRKTIRLAPLTPKKTIEDRTEEYIDTYEQNRSDLLRAFEESDITDVSRTQVAKVKEIREKIVRVRHILEVRSKYPSPQKETIDSYIIVIQNFESGKYPDEKDAIRKLLDVLNGIINIPALFGFPLSIVSAFFTPLMSEITAVIGLVELNEGYQKQKRESLDRPLQRPIVRHDPKSEIEGQETRTYPSVYTHPPHLRPLKKDHGPGGNFGKRYEHSVNSRKAWKERRKRKG